MAEQKGSVSVETPEVEKQSVSRAMDEAAEYLAHSAGFAPLSPEDEKKMIRKMDWILLPMVCYKPPLRVHEQANPFLALYDRYLGCC
jgi:hypothetical protein